MKGHILEKNNSNTHFSIPTPMLQHSHSP